MPAKLTAPRLVLDIQWILSVLPNGARLSCGATFEHAQTYDSSNRRRRQLQAQVRPATIEPHDEHTLALHGHEPRTLPRAPTNTVFFAAPRPNGARLSSGATFEHAQTIDSSHRRRRHLRPR